VVDGVKLERSFKQLMNRIIDYAGLFPPAKLGMSEAVSNYAKYKSEADAWMLSRFICPANRLPEFGQEFRKITNPRIPWKMSVLVGKGVTPEEYFDSLNQDILNLSRFVESFGKDIVVDFMETRLPAELFEVITVESVTSFVISLSNILKKHRVTQVVLFLEIDQSKNWENNVSTFIGFLSHVLQLVSDLDCILSGIGFKLRCGGLDATAFPSSQQVSVAIEKCTLNNVAFKATAGLHHPVRHFNQGVNTKMHGFLNVFGAALLAFKHKLPLEKIKQIVEDENPDNFIFTDSLFKWNKLEISTSEIQSFRLEKVISFGSCSFDEPREDLRSLNLL
jgi:hypothetical protein